MSLQQPVCLKRWKISRVVKDSYGFRIYQTVRFLVALNFVGSLWAFLQNIYFQVEIAIDSSYDCKVFDFPGDPTLTADANSIYTLILKLVQTFWPFFLTCWIFRVRSTPKTPEQNTIEYYHIDTTRPLLSNSQNQSSKYSES